MTTKKPRCHFTVNQQIRLITILNTLLLSNGCIDHQPPALAIQPPPAGVLRGEVVVGVFAEDGASLIGRIDDGPALTLRGPDWRIDGSDLADGPHVVTLQATDHAGNTASLSLPLSTDNTPPVLTLAPTQGHQGGSMALVIHSSEPLAALSGQFLERARTLYPLDETTHRAMVGVAIQQAPGEHPLTLQATDHAGNTTTHTTPIDIAPSDFPRGGFIRLSGSQIAARSDEPARARTRKERSDAYTIRSPEALWTGPLLRPIDGRRTSGFGRYRTYSDGRRSYHYGTDLANITGTPVHAAAAGTILHAGWQHIFGNVVIIDHGQGVSTSYNHLSAVAVEVGAQVDAGAHIGAVGSTGQSTGPHLHWGLVVDGVSVDPEQWLTPQPWQ